jgi:type VI secretion system protein ImpG
MHLLYELLLFRAGSVRVAAGPDGPAVDLPADALRPAGLEPGEALLEDGPGFDPGARLLWEYFACPDAFMFVRLGGLERAPLAGDRLQVRIPFPRWGDGERHRRLADALGPGHFRLGCVPAVNLFRHSAAPIRVTHRQPAYPVVPEGLRPEACEIHSIDGVTRVVAGAGADAATPVPPLYAAGHPIPDNAPGPFWHAARGRDPGGPAPVQLALVEREFRTRRPGPEVLAVGLTCSNRDLPARIPFGGGGAGRADFLLPDQPEAPWARVLRKPTPARRAPDKPDLLFRLLARLTSTRLAPGSADAAGLRQALLLEHPGGLGPDGPLSAGPIAGIVGCQARPCTAWISGRPSSTPVQGTEVTVTFDESRLAGTNLYLFATILERWFGQLCAPNAFVQFRMATCQQEGVITRWPPRTAAGPLT